MERVPRLTPVAADVATVGGPRQARRLWRAVNRLFRRHRRLGLGALLTPPVAWLLVVYIASLVMLVVSAFFGLDSSQRPTTDFTTENITKAFTTGTAIWLFIRTIGIALLVTVLCVVLAVPCAFFVAKVAPRWMRRAIIVSMLLPLWAGYMVKAYAWRAMVSPAAGSKFAAEGRGGGGFLASTLNWTPGYGMVAVVVSLVYFWLPYMVLPIYSGLERLPNSFVDAAGDLGARPWRTFRSVIAPMLLPSIAAGSIFTFSLTLGDYLLPRIMVDGKKTVMFGQFINSIYGAPNQPLAAAYTIMPLVLIVAYLFAMKRAGAFENL